ncbi:MAG TPA: zinc ribbon domain-containing protein [Planctomycetota bacterium]|nr:zinc ribbon domain-containing protein [Planctomycetota bacterium]
MLCKKCGADNAINRLYCDNCGAELEHDLADIQAAVDREIKSDKAKVTSHSIRWLLGVSFVLFVIGILFRSAYKDLPVNDLVPFISAPAVELTEPPTVTTTHFGLDLPVLNPAPPPRATRTDHIFKAQVADEAYRRVAVTVQAKNLKEPVSGLIVTDLVLHFIPTGEATPTRVHAADIAALAPTAGGLWDLTARSLDKPLRGSFADAATLDLHLLHRTPDKKVVTDTISLRNIIEIKPLEADQPEKP